MDLSKKKKIILSEEKKTKFTNIDIIIDLLDNPDKADIPLNSVKVIDDNDWKVARNLSLLNYVDDIIDVMSYSYKRKSYLLQLSVIEQYITAFVPTNNIEQYTKWQSWFRLDTSILPLYASVIDTALKSVKQDIRFLLTDIIEDDKTFILGYPLVTMEALGANIKFRALGFIPQGPLVSVTDILAKHGKQSNNNDLQVLVDIETVLILVYKTISPIEINTWMLKDLPYTKQILGEYNQYRGISNGVLIRSENIKYLSHVGEHKKAGPTKRSIGQYEVLGNVETYKYGIVLETLNGETWRHMCPFNAVNEYRIKKHILAPYLAYAEYVPDYDDQKHVSRLAAYNKHQERMIMDKMFFSRTMQPNIEYLESLAKDVDMASVKHSLITEITKKVDDIDIGNDVKNYYHVISYMQRLELKTLIISILLDEFRELTSHDEFKGIFDKSSFPTSEIMLSYIVEMQQFAHILQKTIMDNVKEMQHEFDKKTMTIDNILRNAIQSAIDEKIKQEGSIMTIINFKGRLLHIDSY